MDTQQPSAPAHPPSGVTRDTRRPHHSYGVTHANSRHTSRFTVIGNHLAQHPELSLLAIGLAVHIQSLPTGARVDIKSLAARFTEGASRISAALRELEAFGYLRRTRERIPDGRIVTRTVSCNQPGRPARREAPDTRPPPAEPQRPARREPAPLLVPRPGFPAPALLQQAADLLAGLHRTDPRLLLSARDAAQLIPGVAAWLERDTTPAAVHHALTANLPPPPLHRPSALLAHRLTAQLPPPPPFRPLTERHPLQNCDLCDRAFRAPEPGTCGGCRTTALASQHSGRRS
ncbi:helix-turn-helix domain-containing protein [Streptomyces sp. NPDC020141]|uniref:helix-turn-helix domain-containing protein n=1 Tax=Streptomyces sp. NPDC020141 TaxID=3365065 RepID=UPI0037B386F6